MKKEHNIEEIYSDSKYYSHSKKKFNKKVQREDRPKKRWKRIVIIILLIFAILFASAASLFFYVFSGLKTTSITGNDSVLGIDSGYKSHGVVNIALFGVDTRDYSENTGRSDSIMVASIDKKAGEIKLSSILRDSRVSIDGHGKNKLAHAYAYGKAPLAIKTLNQNYHLDIREYITVNFEQMAEVIDAMGGLDLTITEKERVATNGILASTPGITSPFIESSGTVHLDGQQATTYARIRKLDSDAMRAERQQVVLEALFDKVLAMNVTQYPSFIKKVLPLVETSLSYTDILSLTPILLKGKPQISTTKVPNGEDNAKGGIVDGIWYYQYDLNAASKRLHSFIYGKYE